MRRRWQLQIPRRGTGLSLHQDRRSASSAGLSPVGRSGPRVCLPLHAGLLPGMAHASAPRPDAVRRHRQGSRRSTARKRGGAGAALTGHGSEADNRTDPGRAAGPVSNRCWPIWQPSPATPSPPQSRPTIRSASSPGQPPSSTRRSNSSASVVASSSGLARRIVPPIQGLRGADSKRGKTVGSPPFFPCANSAPWILCVMCRRPLFLP